MPTPQDLHALIATAAHAQGFAKAGVARAHAVGDGHRFLAWMEAGQHGTMGWLAKRTQWRLDPREYFAGCESVIVVAEPYWSGEAASGPCGRVSNYAWGTGDYHEHMRGRLQAVADALDAAAGSQSKAVVDTAPVLEKYWAVQAGIGWLGKHTNVLSRELGSWFFLGVILTTAVIEADAPAPDHCGTCTACLDACPTGAFPDAYQLDTRRCISYLTIEHRGAIDEGMRDGMGEHLFGCDICQEVCPWNDQPFPIASSPYAPDAAWRTRTPTDVFAWEEGDFKTATRRTPVYRAHRVGLARNLAIVLGNRARAEDVQALAVALQHDDAIVREAAAWALGRIGGAAAHAVLETHAGTEADRTVRRTISLSLTGV